MPAQRGVVEVKATIYSYVAYTGLLPLGSGTKSPIATIARLPHLHVRLTAQLALAACARGATGCPAI